MGVKYTFDTIANLIEHNNNGCILLTTKEDFTEELKKQNKYATQLKLKLKCKCGNIFYKSYNEFCRQKQCSICGNKNMGLKHSKEFADILDYINNVNTGNGCTLLVNQIEFENEKNKQNKSNTKVKLKIMCKCGNEFTTNYDSFKNANQKQCKTCGYMIQKQSILKTHDEFIGEIKKLYNNEYRILENYKGSDVKILVCHNSKDCNNHTWMTTPNNLLNAHGCPKCFGNIKKDSVTFKNEVDNLTGQEYTVLEDYIDANKKIRIQHNNDSCNNFIFKMTPNSFLRGQRCPKCAGNIKKTDDQFKKEVFDLIGKEYLVLGRYVNTAIKIRMKHVVCNCEWEVTPSNFLNGSRCPICNEPKGEQSIRHWLEKNNLFFTTQYSYDDLFGINNGLLKFDFAIFDDENKGKLQCLIEYDGEFHYGIVQYKNESSELAKEKYKNQIYHDNLKNEYCLKNNIKLIRIPYWEFDNIENILGRELI